MTTTQDNVREKLEKTRFGKTHKFGIHCLCGLTQKPVVKEYYITTGEYPDGRLGEVFVKTSQKDDALLDQWCRAVSVLRQYGVSMDKLVDLFGFAKFEPAGMTDNPEIPSCSSPVDYVVRWLRNEYGEEKVLK